MALEFAGPIAIPLTAEIATPLASQTTITIEMASHDGTTATTTRPAYRPAKARTGPMKFEAT